MPGSRIRTIRPDWWKDEEVARLSHGTRLFALGLVSAADDYGVFRAHPVLLRNEVFPYDEDVTPSVIEGWLSDLQAQQVIGTFTAQRQSYGFLVGWNDPMSPWYQKVDRPSKTHRFPLSPRGAQSRAEAPTPPPPAAEPTEAAGDTLEGREALNGAEEVLEWFKAEAPRLGAPSTLTAKRRATTAAFIEELSWSEERMRACFRRMDRTPFLRGKGGAGAFKASFTWLTEDADRAVRVDGGHYGDPEGSSQGASDSPASSVPLENCKGCGTPSTALTDESLCLGCLTNGVPNA